METPIEDRHIPGVTAKQLVVFISGIITILIAIMSTYYSLKSDMKDNYTSLSQLQSESKVRDENIKTLQLQIQTIQLQIATMQVQYETLKNK